MSKFSFSKKIKLVGFIAILMSVSLGTVGYTVSFADDNDTEREIKPKTEKHDKKGLHGKHHKPPMDIDKVKARIQAAVENGQLTQEEADEKLLFMQERLKKGLHGKHKVD
ncbi:hypothetical protein M1N90_02485 [Dehalococcoidia bacterium]|nr:hypothetical protein [Dehalococcoidia bacterium]